MDKITSFNEFQPLALRTESHIESVRTNKRALLALLVANVAVTEILDGVKKQVFYGNATKLLTKTQESVDQLEQMVAILREELTEHSLNDFIDVDPRVFHGIIGLVTESGELADALLSGVTEGGIDAVNIQEEATGDMGWYRAILNDALDLDEYQGLTNVINKLLVRYPDKFSNDLAANRDLASERVQLEKGVEKAPAAAGTWELRNAGTMGLAEGSYSLDQGNGLTINYYSIPDLYKNRV